VADWWAKQRWVDVQYDLVRHSVGESFRWWLVRENFKCSFQGIPTEAYFAAWADLNVYAETTGILSLIGDLGNLGSFQESHVLVRNKGNVKASLNFEAFANMKFNSGTMELISKQRLCPVTILFI
jgi:chitinase